MIDPSLVHAIDLYFQSEREAMFVNLAIAAAVLALVTGLWIVQRDGFSRGLLSVGVLVTILIAGAALFILYRDPARHAALVGAAAWRPAIEAEAARMAAIAANFQRARVAVLLLAVGALAGILSFDRPFVRGCAAGVLLFVLLQIVIDHYSEQRAARYEATLQHR